MNSTEMNLTLYGKPLAMLPYLVLNAMNILIGTFGNLLLFVAIVCTKKLRENVSSIIILNMTLAHLYNNVVVSTFAQLGVMFGDEFFRKIPNLCIIVASTCGIACPNGFFNSVLLAFNRYVFTCYPTLYKRIFTVNKTIIYCLMSWLMFGSIDFVHHFREIGHLFDKHLNACFFNRKINRMYLLMITSSVIVPIVIMFYVYVLLFKRIKYAIRLSMADGLEMLNSDEINYKLENDKTSLNELKATFRFSKGLFVMFMMYAVTIFPFCVVLVIDNQQYASSYWHMYTWLFFRLCSAATPIVYPLFHSSIRRGYINVYKKICRRKSRNPLRYPPKKF